MAASLHAAIYANRYLLVFLWPHSLTTDILAQSLERRSARGVTRFNRRSRRRRMCPRGCRAAHRRARKAVVDRHEFAEVDCAGAHRSRCESRRREMNQRVLESATRNQETTRLSSVEMEKDQEHEDESDAEGHARLGCAETPVAGRFTAEHITARASRAGGGNNSRAARDCG